MDAKDIALIKALGGGGSGGSVTVDSELSDTSTNPVQNRVVKSALDGLSEENAELKQDFSRQSEPNAD